CAECGPIGLHSLVHLNDNAAQLVAAAATPLPPVAQLDRAQPSEGWFAQVRLLPGGPYLSKAPFLLCPVHPLEINQQPLTPSKKAASATFNEPTANISAFNPSDNSPLQ